MSHDDGFTSRTNSLDFGGSDSWDRLLLCAIDGGLAGCLFVIPFLLGGKMALGQLLLVAIAIVVTLAWAARQAIHGQGNWRRTGVELLLLGGVVLLVLQLTPLPSSWLTGLASHTGSLLPLWTEEGKAGAHLGAWSQISLTPAATRDALVLLIAYSLLFLITVQRIRTIDDVERLLRWCAVSAAAMACFGLVQLFTSNDKFFWFYEHPFSRTSDVAKGSFANRNHFAHFLALGLGPMIWWIQSARRRHRRHHSTSIALTAEEASPVRLSTGFRILGLGLLLFAVLLSLSRGGAAVACLAAVISVGVGYRASALGWRFVGGLAGAALLIGICLAIYGQDRVANRLDDFAAGSLESLDRGEGRRTIWTATLKAIPDFLLLGSGSGSLQHVYPMYLPRQDSDLYYTHAENGYLQVALETGLAGLILTLMGVAICAFWCISGLRNATSKRILVGVGAVTASLAVSVVHSLVDFVWYTPACMATAAILAACACRLRQLAGEEQGQRFRRVAFPSLLAAAICAVVLVLGGWMLSGRLGPIQAEPHWFRYLVLQRTALAALPFDGNSEQGNDPQDERETALALEQKAVFELEQVTHWDPNNARAHLKLAGAYMRLFDRLQASSTVNVMPLSEVSDAATRSGFASRKELDQWLARAVGEHAKYLDLALQHARQGLMLCPLEGEGYLYLGELSFLEGGTPSLKPACLAQAIKVRPYDGTVLFYAGQKAAMAGDIEGALRCWKQSFDCGRPYQRNLLDDLIGRTHPDHLEAEIQMLTESFQPDLPALRWMYRRYKAIAKAEQLAVLNLTLAQKAEAEAAVAEKEAAGQLWLEAMSHYAELGDATRQLQCGRKALELNANDYWAHYGVGGCLADLQQYPEAEEHLRWCLQRKPDNRRLEQKLQEVVQRRVRTQGESATLGPGEAYRR
jgi:O-antigen ligase/tetratricopeptide (TPR) repeat protein